MPRHGNSAALNRSPRRDSARFGNSVESLTGIVDQREYEIPARRLLAGKGFTVATRWWAHRLQQTTAHWSNLNMPNVAGKYAIYGANPLIA